MDDRPLVLVLLATHNGADYLREQVASILDQRDVNVRIVISDDGSTDTTVDIIEELSADPRVEVLPAGDFGSAHANFLRLIRETEVGEPAAIAFSDQDDVWNSDRLVHQLEQLRDADAVSANVIADFGDRRVLVDKAQPQRAFDYVLESAGPGCTFVLSRRAFDRVRRVVLEDPEAGDAAIHDWLAYAVVRAAGMRWHIDPKPIVDYRQHDRNVAGANVGVRSARRRLRRLGNGSFRREAAVIARIAARAAEGERRTQLEAIARLLERNDIAARWSLLRGIGSLRRRRTDRLVLAGLLFFGVW